MKPGRPASAPVIEGATNRQIDYWIRAGYLAIERRGTGNRHEWTDEELRVARAMARLIAAGLTPGAAHVVARELKDSDAVLLAPGVAVLVRDPEDPS